MLHPSRGSSFALEPLITRLADRHTVIALDSPGNGESDPLPIDRPTIADYTAALGETLAALGIERCDLYGAHTGAKIGLEFAATQPNMVRRLVLDGLAIYTENERAEMIAHYAPPLTPEPDATHWVRAWAMLRNMAIFWPWFRRDRHSRIVADLPSAEDLHHRFVDLLRSVPDYWKGYQAAFAYDGLATLRRIPVPSLLTAAISDPLASHLTRATDLPATVRVIVPEPAGVRTNRSDLEGPPAGARAGRDGGEPGDPPADARAGLKPPRSATKPLRGWGTGASASQEVDADSGRAASRGWTSPPEIEPPVDPGIDDLADRILAFLAGDVLPEAPAAPAVESVVGVVRRDYGSSRVGQLLMRKSGGGSGRPLVLFHGSPGTSRSLEPMLVRWGQDRPVFTFDTPGIGDSASPAPGTTIRDVAAIIGDALDELGLGEFDVYGSRTGSCIGIELAIARPDQVRRLIVDGPVLFTEEYLDWMLRSYLPILTPVENGSHLLVAWNFRRDQGLFWPWFNHTRNGVLGRLAFTSDHEANNLLGESLHRGFSDFLKGGLTYQIPYRAGITFPTRERLPLVEQPVLLCTNEHDVFRPGMPEARRLLRNGVSRIYPDLGSVEAIAVTDDLFRRFFADEPLPAMLGEE